LQAFLAALPTDEPLLMLGLGSNLLVSDDGFAGTVICLYPQFSQISLLENGQLFAQSGVHCAALAKFAEKQKRGGLGFMAGIPGTVGGALAMNAGAWGGETWPQVQSVQALFRNGELLELPASAFSYRYRHVDLPTGFLAFVGVTFNTFPDQDGSYAQQTKHSLAQRKATQPVGKPSAGSTFTNPPGHAAARLIEQCGLKGTRIGGAEVSVQHANFLITDPSATAADVQALIAHIQATVLAQTGVALHTEVRRVGFKDSV
jgi:UDP-N-acetylmuramate dehydrogenase